MSVVGGGSRVPIPSNVRKMIQDIREITGKQHSDEDIYAVLKDCCMDPNETIQKLLNLDTFHEVKRRRDRKKEGLNRKASEESGSKQGGQGRGARGGQGNYSSKFSDAGGGRTVTSQRENGVNQNAERSLALSSVSGPQKSKDNRASQVSRASSSVSNGPGNQSNASSVHSLAPQSHAGGVMYVRKGHDTLSMSKEEGSQPQSVAAVYSSSLSATFNSAVRLDQGKSPSTSDQSLSSGSVSVSGVYSSSSDPVLAPSLSRISGAAGAIRREVGNQCIAAGSNHIKGDKVVPYDGGDVVVSTIKKSASDSVNTVQNNTTPDKSSEVEKNQLPENSLYDGSLSIKSSSQPPVDKVSMSDAHAYDACTQLPAELKHVTFPNHFQVPESVKNGLTFGSFDSSIGLREKVLHETEGDHSSTLAHESSLGIDETANTSNQSLLLAAKGEYPDYPDIPHYAIEETQHSEGSTVCNVKKDVQPKQEVLLAPEGPPMPTAQNGQNYGLNLMSNMLGTQHVQFEGVEPQEQEASRLQNFVGGNPPVLSSPSPTSHLQSSIPPQSVPIFRPPYPTNFIPYGHYYPPIYVSPIHHFLSHNGFPQQPSAGNMYLPAAAGVKLPFPQIKPGANSGNTAHLGIPSSSFISPPVGYAPSQTVNTGNTAGNEDPAASQLKDNYVYTTGQLSESSAVWIPAPGQDMTGLQVNSLYNLPPQGHHVTFPTAQAGHGSFAGMYQPLQTVATPSTILQQSQAVAGAIETVGPPSATYQQPQHAHVNWNTNF